MSNTPSLKSDAPASPIILIAEDEAVSHDAISAVLSNQDYTLAFAETGSQALEQAMRLLPDLILLGAMLPDMDGYQVCRTLRAEPNLAQVPVVMITAFDDQEARAQGLASGVDDFISTPFNRAELYARVRTLMQLNRCHALLKEHQASINLNRQMLELQEQFRAMVSTELYDYVLENLSSLKQLVRQALRKALRPNAVLETTLATLDDLAAHVRNLSLDLRPTLLDDFGLYPTLTWLSDQTQHQTGLDVRRNFTQAQDNRYAPMIETAVFRITQEAVTNIVQHAKATEMTIELEERNGLLRLKIDDNGMGFDLASLIKLKPHLSGIFVMHERARMAGGSLIIESVPKHGTHIVASFPVATKIV